MSCIYDQCPHPISNLCICSKSSFLCSFHSLIHQNTCKQPQIPLNSLRSEEESERLKTLLNQIRNSVLEAKSLLLISIEEIVEKFLNDLNKIDLFVNYADSVIIPRQDFQILDEVLIWVKDFLGIKNFSIEEILNIDQKELSGNEFSLSTAGSFAFADIHKNPVGMPLEKEEGINWLQENGFEFKSEEICEITTNKEANYAYLC
jgi:hypothetical protein